MSGDRKWQSQLPYRTIAVGRRSRCRWRSRSEWTGPPSPAAVKDSVKMIPRSRLLHAASGLQRQQKHPHKRGGSSLRPDTLCFMLIDAGGNWMVSVIVVSGCLPGKSTNCR